MTVHAAWLLPSGQTLQDTRLTQLGATLPADPLKVQSGILPGSADGSARLAAFWLENQSGMSATIDPGRAVIQGMAAQGAYPVTLSEVTQVTFGEGDAQYDRIDLVCLRVYDASYDDPTGQTTATLEVIPGKPAAPPVPPATPDLALPLYTVTVPAGASTGAGGVDWATVQDLRVSTVATGGVLPAYGNAAVAGSYVGQLRDLHDVLQRWNGTAWVPYPQGIGGIAPSSTVNGAYPGQYRDCTEGRLQRWNGTAWEEVVTSWNFWGEDGLAGGSTASATYVSTLTGSSTAATVNFLVPASGAVVVRLGARISTSSSTGSAYISPSIALGSSTLWLTNDYFAVVGSGTGPNSVVAEFRAFGLPAGAVCTATLHFRSSSSSVTASFHGRYLRIDPTH
jgi:hypothetical protein